jgi:hypothetical protein
MRFSLRRRREPHNICIDPDYGIPWPLWDKNGPIYNPQDLGISEALLDDIRVWFEEWSEVRTGEPLTEAEAEADELRFVREGHDLARRLSAELGDGYRVTYLD